LEDLLEIVGFDAMAEGVRAGRHSERWRERIPLGHTHANTLTTGPLLYPDHYGGW